jgi:hypothetical protein
MRPNVRIPDATTRRLLIPKIPCLDSSAAVSWACREQDPVQYALVRSEGSSAEMDVLGGQGLDTIVRGVENLEIRARSTGCHSTYRLWSENYIWCQKSIFTFLGQEGTHRGRDQEILQDIL